TAPVGVRPKHRDAEMNRERTRATEAVVSRRIRTPPRTIIGWTKWLDQSNWNFLPHSFHDCQENLRWTWNIVLNPSSSLRGQKKGLSALKSVQATTKSAPTFLNLDRVQSFRQLQLELVKNPLLVLIQLADAAQPNFFTFYRGQYDIHAVQLG